ncbi:hypothetical protein [Pseudonocardia alaniniphila]|uniref:Circularly permuted ATP-grasp superfamily protein n=1 Tax=Pseudonocardia alaniniphila TaxID=75291 RepID=A0ABS9TCC3_9PSEU|nr:hypothetical protein [Pseudonocardia alaniniphila]MCH6166195.1 hypothetical protein [Pseudonocardia alaniniphila]
MADNDRIDLVVEDVWDELPEELRRELVERRTTSSEWGPYAREGWPGRRWEPLRPVVVRERAYRGLEFIASRLLRLAVEACCRRASTLGELHRVLRFPHQIPVMNPDRPLVPEELNRYARPDILIEKGRPRFLEFNISTRLGGDAVARWLADAYTELCPEIGLRTPPSTVAARCAALNRTLPVESRNGAPGRLLIPIHSVVDGRGARQRRDQIKPRIVAGAQQLGFEVFQADLADLSLDADGRLLASEVPLDVVLLRWYAHDRIIEDGGGLAALRTADRAGTVGLFPRPESTLVSSKAVLSWLREDCDAGVLGPADRALVRAYVPWTVCLGLGGNPEVERNLLRMAAGERDRLVAKPAVGQSSEDVIFGNQTSAQDWQSAVADVARETPLVLQRRVESGRVTMPFRDRESGQQVTARVPFVLSLFMVDRAAAGILARHMTPDLPAGDVVIGMRHGARPNAVLFAPAS